MKIGVLALQGDFAEHLAMLKRIVENGCTYPNLHLNSYKLGGIGLWNLGERPKSPKEVARRRRASLKSSPAVGTSAPSSAP